MDPDECLLEMLVDARSILMVSTDLQDIAQAERILNLNEWLSKGGFLPTAWRVARTDDSQSRSGL